MPCLIAVEQNATGDAYKLALAYAAGIGGARGGVMETTFQDETETDLFGEQAVLCGGVVELMKLGFETLVEAGYEPENAYFECIHEMKLIIDLINKGGVAAMKLLHLRHRGVREYVSGPRVLPYEETKKNMKAVLTDIQDGVFAGKWIAENKNGRTFFNAKRAQLAKHQMETVGAELRKNMLWGDDTDLDHCLQLTFALQIKHPPATAGGCFLRNIQNRLDFLSAQYIFNVRTEKEGKSMSPSQGRPKIENPKTERLYIRITPEEKAEIQQFCLSTGYSLLELIRLGIKSAQK